MDQSDKPGTDNMAQGVGWAILGGAVTVVTLYVPLGFGIIAYGAIIGGVIQFVVGLVQYLSYRSSVREREQEVRAGASVRAILRAMLATSIADGKLHDKEVAAIRSIFLQIFGSSVEEQVIRDTAEEMLKEDFDIADAMRNDRAIIKPEITPTILKAAFFVASADGSIDDNEIEVLGVIASALGMSESAISTLIDELRQ